MAGPQEAALIIIVTGHFFQWFHLPYLAVLAMELTIQIFGLLSLYSQHSYKEPRSDGLGDTEVYPAAGPGVIHLFPVYLQNN